MVDIKPQHTGFVASARIGCGAVDMLEMPVDQTNDVIQKWRDTPDGGWTAEDHQLFKDITITCLAQGQSAQLLTFLQDVKNQGIVRSMGCNLLGPIANEIVRKQKSLGHCEAAMTHLTKTCKPNELLRGMLELIEDIDPDVIADTITALTPHLQTVILLMEDKAAPLGLALSALQKQISRLPVPYTQQHEEEDQYGLCRSCSALAEFVKPFVEEVQSDDGKTSAAPGDLKAELYNFCIGCLREPLLQSQLDQSRKSQLWFFATEIMRTLLAVRKNIPDLLFYIRPRRSILWDNPETKESRACIAYLLFVQHIAMESFPAVLSPVFILERNMEYINLLLNRKDESFLLKGLELYAKSLAYVQDRSLPVNLLGLEIFYTVPQNLRKILTDCPMQHLRERALQVFQLFINKLDAEAKHRFFRCMLKTSSHAGVEGFVIKNIKNEVKFSMEPGKGNGWFLGAEFPSLLELVLTLQQGAETDLLHGMDRIMESLNLLRFLLIRDREWKRNSGVWAELCRLKREYLKMLRVSLSISRAYYAGEVKALREDHKLKAKEARVTAKSTGLVKNLTVRHKKDSDMSPEVQYQVLQSALVTFDLMESLIVRIEEITEEKAKIQN